MKKLYTKPMIATESLSLDSPIAFNCTADFDDVKSLVDLGVFTSDRNCMMLPDADGSIFGSNEICYHSNVTIAFTS